MNYAGMMPDEHGFLKCTSLRLPERDDGGGGITSDFPKATELRGKELIYEYSDKRPVTVPIDSLEKYDDPTPLG